jgi:hypothetical protein
MRFGTKKRDVQESEFNDKYLRNFKNGETKVRFLEEPEEWILYQEHFTRDRQSFPCTMDTTSCPGCISEDEQMQRRSRKYGTHLLLVEPNIVLPFKISITLASRLTARAERNNGTIVNRDYLILRSGEGLRTEYDVDADEKYPLDTDALLTKATASIEEILQDMFTQVWGDPDQYKPKDEYRPKAKLSSVSKQDDDVPDALKLKHEREGMDVYVPPADDEITEAQIRAMTRSQLIALWKKAGWDGFNDDWNKTEIIDAILAKAD